MSATSATLEAPARTAVVRGRVTQARVIRSEWTKLWSLRSTRWTLLVAIIGMVGLGPLIATVQMNRWNHLDPGDRLHFNPINTGLGGYHFAQLAIGVLGVLVLSGEYSTGQIRSSFMAVPKRLPVLWAKAGTFATVTFVLMLISGLIAFLASQSILTQHHVQTSLSHAPALRAKPASGGTGGPQETRGGDVRVEENPPPALRAKPAAGGTGGRPPGRYQGPGKLGRRPSEHESLMRRRDRSAAADGGTAWRAFPFADGGTAWSQRRRTTSPYKVADTQTSRELRDTPATSTPHGRRDQRHAAHGRPTVLSLAHG